MGSLKGATPFWALLFPPVQPPVLWLLLRGEKKRGNYSRERFPAKGRLAESVCRNTFVFLSLFRPYDVGLSLSPSLLLGVQ
jgi:hypothetical protein